MDLSAGLALLNLLSLNVQLIPSEGEMEKRFEADQRIRQDIFKNYDGSMPFKKDPIQIIPIMSIDHIREVNEEKGAMTVSMTFTFTWMDERLTWDPKNYSGVNVITGRRYEFWRTNIWLPTINLADMPGSAKEADLFRNHDVELFIKCTGTVRAVIKVLVTTPCYFAFGDYPHDYQNCSFTMMSPYFADVFKFASWGGVEFARYMLEERITDVGDFQLIGVDTRNYYMYLGLEIVEDFSKYKEKYCRGFFRYNMMLKRVNNLVYSQISTPMIAISIFLGISGLLPNKYGLLVLLCSIGYEFFYVINLERILPDDFNGMPNIGVLAIFLFTETITLTVWKVFSIYTRNRNFYVVYPDGFIGEPNARNAQILQIVFWTDRILMVALCLQCFVNIHIIRKN